MKYYKHKFSKWERISNFFDDHVFALPALIISFMILFVGVGIFIDSGNTYLTTIKIYNANGILLEEYSGTGYYDVDFKHKTRRYSNGSLVFYVNDPDDGTGPITITLEDGSKVTVSGGTVVKKRELVND